VTLRVLLETEEELSALIASAEQEGRQIVEAARSRVQELELAALSELRVVLQTIDREGETAIDQEVDQAGAKAKAEVERFDAVPDALVEQLADDVLRDFLGVSVLRPRAALR
jgi:vacuolar-type H+-ATPase subunit H